MLSLFHFTLFLSWLLYSNLIYSKVMRWSVFNWRLQFVVIMLCTPLSQLWKVFGDIKHFYTWNPCLTVFFVVWDVYVRINVRSEFGCWTLYILRDKERVTRTLHVENSASTLWFVQSWQLTFCSQWQLKYTRPSTGTRLIYCISG